MATYLVRLSWNRILKRARLHYAESVQLRTSPGLAFEDALPQALPFTSGPGALAGMLVEIRMAFIARELIAD